VWLISDSSTQIDFGHCEVLHSRNITEQTRELLWLSSNHLRLIINLLTGDSHLKGYLFELGPIANPVHNKCMNKEETTSYIYNVIVRLGHWHLEARFMSPNCWPDYLINQTCRIAIGLIGWGTTIDLNCLWCKGCLYPTLLILLFSYFYCHSLYYKSLIICNDIVFCRRYHTGNCWCHHVSFWFVIAKWCQMKLLTVLASNIMLLPGSLCFLM
jgi:hypothetical protein